MRRSTSETWQQSAALGALARRDCFARPDLPACLRAIVRTAVSTMEVSRVAAWLLQQDGTLFECADILDADGASPPRPRPIAASELLSGFGAPREGRSLVSEAAAGTAALLATPILLRGRTAGFLVFEPADSGREWTCDDQTFASSLADFATLALANEELCRTDERLQLAATVTRLATWGHDLTTGRTWWSPEYYMLLGYHSGQIEPGVASWKTLVHPDERALAFAVVDDCLRGRRSDYRCIYRMRTASGSWIWVEDAARLIRDGQGQPIRWVGIKVDVTARKEAERALHTAEERFRSLFDNAVEGFWHVAPDGTILQVNPALARMLDYPCPASLGRWVENARKLFVEPARWVELLFLLDQQDRILGFEAELAARDGQRVWASLNLRAMRDERNQVTFIEGSVTDITHIRRAQAQLAHAAFHDGLTGLPNRHLLIDRMGQALSRCRLNPTGSTAVILVDYDDLKLINDSLGHGVGDAMLVELAHRLKSAARPGDTVARIGSDEFAILAEGLADPASAVRLAEALRAAAVAPLSLHGHDVFPSVSVGVAFDAGECEEPEDLLRDAGTALHEGKSLGRGRTHLFAPVMRSEPLMILRLQSDLRRALERDELALYFQPIVDLSTRNPIGFEALLRWQHPKQGLISPSLFIPIAEQAGIMPELGTWVMRRAFRQLAQWQARLTPGTALSVSVNIPPSQLTAADLFATIDGLLAETGADARRVKLEVTETALGGDAELVAQRLRGLRDRGLSILIDDFGTGYSSLSRLHRFSIDGLKIDQSFVRPLLVDRDCAVIARSIVALGKALGLHIIAEGVEDDATAIELLRLNCDQAQGYYFARPLPPDAADALVADLALGRSPCAVGS